MLADGHYVDGSWLLKVHIDELNIDREVRVQGDWCVGELLTELTTGLKAPYEKPPDPNEFNLVSGTMKTGWSQRKLWWPAKSRWLLHTGSSLNQYGVQADALLRLVPIYGRLQIQLPDLQRKDFCNVNYSEPVFRMVIAICRQLNIRHPEELSLARPITQRDLKPTKSVQPVFADRRQHTGIGFRGTFQRSATINTTHTQSKLKRESIEQQNTPDTQLPKENNLSRNISQVSRHSVHLFGPPVLRDRRGMIQKFDRKWRTNSLCLNKAYYSPESMHTIAFELRALEDPHLSASPSVGVDEAYCKRYITRPSGFTQRLRLNVGWLDSARSLMEQGLDVTSSVCGINQKENNTLSSGTLPTEHSEHNNTISYKHATPPYVLLRFKYGTFYDLNTKYDVVRINQLYEQAKWSVLSEIYDTTDDEACLLAALQARVEVAAEQEQTTETVVDGLNDSEVQLDMERSETSVNSITDQNTLKQRAKCLTAQSRDISPIGGYLRHQRTPKAKKDRPLSVIELEREIDQMLEDLCQTDLCSLANGRRSRSRQRAPRTLSISGPVLKGLEPKDPGPPQLQAYIKLCKIKRLGLKVFRKFFVVADKLKLMIYKTQEDFPEKLETAEVIFLPGCEVRPDLSLISERFNIHLFVPITKTNLPLSAAFGKTGVEDQRMVDNELGVGGRLRRRASLLSLTSLSQFGNAFGLQQTSHSSSGLCGSSAAALGLMNEIIFRFTGSQEYADWLAFLRLATAIPPGAVFDEDQVDSNGPLLNEQHESILTREVFDAEQKAIHDLVELLSPEPDSSDQVDAATKEQCAMLYAKLDKRFIDYLPMRLGLGKAVSHNVDQVDSGQGRNLSLLANGRHPTSQTTVALPNQLKLSLSKRIGVTYSRLQHLTNMQAKLKYISAWEQLTNHGIVFFPAKFQITLPLITLLTANEQQADSGYYGLSVPWINRPSGGGCITVSSSKRTEAVGIGPTRIFRCDLTTGDVMASWRISAIQSWHINWELGELVLMLAPPNTKHTNQRSISPSPASGTDFAGRVIIRPIEVSVRTVAEFLGGYAFLNLRSPEKNQCLDETTFYKLTTGSAAPIEYYTAKTNF